MTERHTSRALARDLPAEFRKPDGQVVEAYVTQEHAEYLEKCGVKVDPKRILPSLIPPADISRSTTSFVERGVRTAMAKRLGIPGSVRMQAGVPIQEMFEAGYRLSADTKVWYWKPPIAPPPEVQSDDEWDFF